MRSGNGRHRRPRQAPALFVTAGVTGAGLAMPLLAAGSAQAADGATWDRVAECESGGLWSANAGNGYYGGLQLTMETWKDYGGSALADRPDLASRGQQIEVAEKILADQGPEAWPSCSVGAGLLPDVEVPDVEVPDVEVPDAEVPEVPDVPDVELPDVPDPDVPDAPELPDDRDDTDGSGQDEADEGDDDAGGDAGGDDAAGGSTEGGSTGGGSEEEPAPAPEDSAGGDSGTGSGVDPDEADEQDAPGEQDDRTDGDASGRHRGGSGEERSDDGDRSSRGKHGKPGDAGRADDAYLVRPGDSLSEIAAEQDLDGGWTALYEGNRETVGDDPDLIIPGQRLDLLTGGELR